MKQNLVPEMRTDKNGVTSKKWVKPTESTTDRNWASQPILMNKKVRAETIKKLANEMHDLVNGPEVFDWDLFSSFEKNLVKYSDSALTQIESFLEGHAFGFGYNGTNQSTVAEIIGNEAGEELILGLINYLPKVSFSSIIAFTYYREQHGIQWDEESKTDPRMVALMRTAETADRTKKRVAEVVGPKNNWGIPVIQDSRLIKLVMDRHDDNEFINSLIKEHKTADYERISAILDSPSKPLSNGIL